MFDLGSWIYWLQFAGLVVIVLGIFALAVRLLGWNRVKGWIVPVIGFLAVAGAATKIRQSGNDDRKRQEQDALKKAEVLVEKKRDEIQKAPDKDLDDRLSKWEKP